MGSNDVRALHLEVAPHGDGGAEQADDHAEQHERAVRGVVDLHGDADACLLYTSDAADD